MRFYVSTYTEGFFGEGPNGSEGIYLCDYNESNNEFTVLDSFSNSVNPSFIRLSKDRKNLFVACEKLPPSFLTSYAVDDEGRLKLCDSIRLDDFRSCCYMSVDSERNFVAVANYGTGEVFTYLLDDEGRYGKLISSFRNDDSEIGPNTDRQELPHAHSIRLIEALDTYVACDLGCDKISFYSHREDGTLESAKISNLKTAPGYGPRHTCNSIDGRFLYVTCELSNMVLFYELVDGQYVLRQEISSLPEGADKENTCADIHISKDNRYVFVSNRGSDNIVQYRVMEDGKLEMLCDIACGGQGPRSFVLCDDIIICANQDSGNVSILELKDGIMTGNILSNHDFVSPVCIEIFE